MPYSITDKLFYLFTIPVQFVSVLHIPLIILYSDNKLGIVCQHLLGTHYIYQWFGDFFYGYIYVNHICKVWNICKCQLNTDQLYLSAGHLCLSMTFLPLTSNMCQSVFTEEQTTRNITLFVLITELLTFDNCSCPEHNLKSTGWNFIKLHTMVEYNERKCSVQET